MVLEITQPNAMEWIELSKSEKYETTALCEQRSKRQFEI